MQYGHRAFVYILHNPSTPEMIKLPPPDLKMRPSPPLPTWMRLMPKGFPANCRDLSKLPPPNLRVERDPALLNEHQFMRVVGSVGSDETAAA
jgi:hypothetical protein